MRFAGTWKQYSKKAMPQLARITFHNASLRYLRWPYQANVIKMFEMVSRKIVLTRPPAQRSVSSLTPRNGEPFQSVIIHTGKQIRRGTNQSLQYGVRDRGETSGQSWRELA